MANLILRNIKGSALTFDELDSNFLALDSDVTVINNTLSAGVGLGEDSVNSLIDLRVDSDAFVRLTTDQTIAGVKTFQDSVVANNLVQINGTPDPSSTLSGEFLTIKPALRVWNSTGGSGLYLEDATLNTTQLFQNNATNEFRIARNTVTRMSIDSDGDVRAHNRMVIAPNPNAVTPSAVLHVFMDGTTFINPTFEKANDAAGGIAIAQKRSRGTLASPTALQKDDVVGGFTGQGYDGNNYQFSAGIRYKVDSAVAAGVVPMRMTFETSETSNAVERFIIKSDGNISTGADGQTLTVLNSASALDVVLGGTGTIAGNTWTNGAFHLGDSVSGWAMDRNELYNGGAAIIGTLDGTLTLAPNTVTTTSRQFQSSVTTGTAPFTVASTTLVTNLNADRLDGQDGSHYRIEIYDRTGTLLN